MAHQAHNIPWKLLASNLRYVYKDANDRSHDVTDLYLRRRREQGGELNHFVHAFSKNIEQHSLEESVKCPPIIEDASPEDVIITEKVAQKIARTVGRIESFEPGQRHRSRLAGDSYRDVLPPNKRTMAAFLKPYRVNDCYKFHEVNGEAYEALEILKTLVLHGEMEPILRICTHPDIDYLDWWCVSECMCCPSDLGWDQVCKIALRSYICLNTLYCFPAIWDASSGRSELNDYRRTRCYQWMLKHTTIDGSSSLPYLPHREFFGIRDDHFSHFPTPIDKPRWGEFAERFKFENHYPYGKVDMDGFLQVERHPYYLPVASDIPKVRSVLALKGLPVELQLDIMDLAEYTPGRRLEIAHDPLHPGNLVELQKYLKYCWKLLIRCDMTAKALGDRIPWESLVSQCLVELWGWSYNDHEKKGRKSLFEFDHYYRDNFSHVKPFILTREEGAAHVFI